MSSHLMEMENIRTVGLLGCLLALFGGCVSYRVVQLGTGVDEQNRVSPLYAVAQHNVVIPEYVVDPYGGYPTSKEEALNRFHSRRVAVEPLVREKYVPPSSFQQSFSRNILGFCLVLVSPVAIPVQWFGEAFAPKERRRSLGKITEDYFALSLNPSSFGKAKIRERIDYFY